MSRNFTITITKIVSGIKKPDTARTVTIRDLDGNIIATATESPANSGQYVATFTEVEKWGWWYVDGAIKNSYSNNSPFWLGNYDSISANTIFAKSITGNIIRAKQDGLRIADGGTNWLIITTPDNYTATRTLNFILGDASQNITLNGSPTLNDWFDQDVKTSGSPGFNSLSATTSISGNTLSAGNIRTAKLWFDDGTSQITAGGSTGSTSTSTTGHLVPYVGATADVNLATHSLTAAAISSEKIYTNSISAGVSGDTGEILFFRETTGKYIKLLPSLMTGNRTLSLPDQTGELATYADVFTRVPYSGASGGVDLASKSLTANSISCATIIANDSISSDSISSTVIVIKHPSTSILRLEGTTTGNSSSVYFNDGITPQFIFYKDTNNDLHIYDNTASKWRFTIKKDTGNVGIGTYTPIAHLHVTGSISAQSLTTVGLIIAGSLSSIGGITGTTISGTLLLAGNFQSITSALQTQIGSLWNSKVPYSGATANLNLANYNLTAGAISATSIIATQSISCQKIYTNSISAGLSGDVGEILFFREATGKYIKLLPALTFANNRTLSLPDKTGELAIYADVSTRIPYDGATGNVNLADMSLTASSISSISISSDSISSTVIVIKHPSTSILRLEGPAPGNSSSVYFSDGNTPQFILYKDTDNNLHVYDDTISKWRLTVKKDTGNVGLGTYTPLAHLHVTGSISAQSITAVSSISSNTLSAGNIKTAKLWFGDGTSQTTANVGGTSATGHLVPYVGATANINLATHSLTANTISAQSISAQQIVITPIATEPSSASVGSIYYHPTGKAMRMINSSGTAGLAGSIYANLANSSLVQGTGITAETAFNLSTTAFANSLAIGKRLRIRAGGNFTIANTKKMRYRIKIGSATCVDTNDITADGNLINYRFWIECETVIRTIGAGGSQSSNGFAIVSLAAPWSKALGTDSTALDTTVDNAITITVQFDNAVGNSVTLEHLSVEVLN